MHQESVVTLDANDTSDGCDVIRPISLDCRALETQNGLMAYKPADIKHMGIRKEDTVLQLYGDYELFNTAQYRAGLYIR